MKHFFPDGTSIDFSEDKLATFEFENLLYNIASERRFNSQVPWSVLQHSIAVGKACEMIFPGNTLLVQHGYLHDIQEAIIRDVPTPIKDMAGRGWWAMEEIIQGKILDYLHIGKLGDEDAQILHKIDKTMSFVEACNFYSPEFCEYMKTRQAYEPELLVYCSSAFDAASSVPLWNDESSINPNFIQLYRQVIYSSIL